MIIIIIMQDKNNNYKLFKSKEKNFYNRCLLNYREKNEMFRD